MSPDSDNPDLHSYFDGNTNRRRLVSLRFGDGLLLLENDAEIAIWRFADIRSFDGPPGMLRLGSIAATALARLDIGQDDVAELVRRNCPDLNGEGSAPHASAWQVVGWSAAAAIGIVAAVFFGLPLLADRLTEAIPYAWEKPLGTIVDKQVRLVFGDKTCASAEGTAALEHLIARLQAAAKLPIQPQAVVLQSKVTNAFAAPGGRVFILSQMLDDAGTPDELAGVLAHEFGHVKHRDGLRRLIREGGTGYLLGLLFGDVSGAGAILFAGRILLNAEYSREVESAADEFAITTMTALGRPTSSLGDLLHRMAGKDTESFSLLMDHPVTSARVQRLEAANQVPTGPPLLSGEQWLDLRHICR